MNSLTGSKILFVVNSFSGGGAENSVMAVTRNLREKGIPVWLCALNRNSSHDLADPSNGLYLLERRWKSGLIATVRNLLIFRRLLVDLRPEILIANCELPELYVALVAPSSSVLGVVEHTSQPWRGRRMLGRLVRTILRFRGANWVTVSPTDNKIWLGSNSPLHIPNPIETPHKWESNDRTRTEIVFIGRLRAEKRPQWVIEASIQNRLRVDLYGDGDQREMLESQYVNTSNRVQFHGYVTNPWDQISLDSLIVVPSEYEGDGMVVAEAIIRNYSVLLADNSDLRRFNLPNSNYFKDQSELADKLAIWKESNREQFTIPEDVMNALIRERDLGEISNRWKAFLYQLAAERKN